MGLLTPTVSPLPTRAKIVFPSQPNPPNAPVLSSSSGGTLAAQTYYVKTTWLIETQDGVLHESLPSNETSLAVAADNLLNVQSPPSVLMPYAVIGWNVYVGTSPGSEKLQNASPLSIGSNWIEPTSGLVVGTPPPTIWGNTIIFNFPGREFPYSSRDWKGHDEFSTSGWQQSLTWYVDMLIDWKMPAIQDGNDVAAWDQFLGVAVQRVPFDLYPDSTQAQFMTLILTSTNPRLAYYQPGLWAVSLKARQVILSQ